MNAMPKRTDFASLSKQVRTMPTIPRGACPCCKSKGVTLAGTGSRAGLMVRYLECNTCGTAWRQVVAGL